MFESQRPNYKSYTLLYVNSVRSRVKKLYQGDLTSISIGDICSFTNLNESSRWVSITFFATFTIPCLELELPSRGVRVGPILGGYLSPPWNLANTAGITPASGGQERKNHVLFSLS